MTAFVLEAFIALMWQGTLLVLLSMIMMRLVPRVSAATRHVVWWLTLLGAIALPVGGVAMRQVARTAGAVAQPAADVAIDVSRKPQSGRSTTQSGLIRTTDQNLHGQTAPAGVAAKLRAQQQLIGDAARYWTLQPSQFLAASIATAWTLIACGLLLRLLRALRTIKTLRASATCIPSLVERSLRETLPVRCDASLLSSNCVSVPVALGFGATAIVFPASMLSSLSVAQLKHVTLHELAHLARRDDWSTLALRVVQALLFFIPAVHLAARRIELEQEMACDEWALMHSRANPREYASSLVRIGELALCSFGAHRNVLSLTPSMSTQLSRRIHELLAQSKQERLRPVASGWRFACVLPLPVMATAIASASAPYIAVAPRSPLHSAPRSVGATVLSRRIDALPQRDSLPQRDVLPRAVVPSARANVHVSNEPARDAVSESSAGASAPAPVASKLDEGKAFSVTTSAAAVFAPTLSPIAIPQLDTSRNTQTRRVVLDDRIVDRRRIVIPHDERDISGARLTETLSTLAHTLEAGTATERAHAAFTSSALRTRALTLVPYLLNQLTDSTPVARSDGATSVAWWNAELRATTSPSEEAAKALLFVGPKARSAVEQFLIGKDGEAKRRTAWVLGLLQRFDK